MSRKTSNAPSGYLGQIGRDLEHRRQRGKVLPHFTLRNLQFKHPRLVVANRHFDNTTEFKFGRYARKLCVVV